MEPRYRYVDACSVTKKLDELIKQPIYSVKKDALTKYETEYYGQRCQGSRVMIDKALDVIPGGVQHNLAFNYPFPLVFTRAQDNRLWDIDGNEYLDFFAGGRPHRAGQQPRGCAREGRRTARHLWAFHRLVS